MEVEDTHPGSHRSGISSSTTTLHMETAKRFLEMVISLDVLGEFYSPQHIEDANMRIIPPMNYLDRTFLRHHLRWWMHSYSTEKICYCHPDDGLCHFIPIDARIREDGRRDLPLSIFETLQETFVPWCAKRVCSLKSLNYDISYKQYLGDGFMDLMLPERSYARSNHGWLGTVSMLSSLPWGW